MVAPGLRFVSSRVVILRRFVSDEGDSAILWHIDDDVTVTPETVNVAESAFERADAVLITFEPPVPTIREAIGVARRCGARVIVQPAPVLVDPAVAASLDWDQVDVVVPNEIEARALLDGSQGDRDLPADDLAGALAAQLAVPIVVVTLEESGCVAHAGSVTRRYSAQQTAAVDTTGASDAFTATLAAHLVAGASEADAIDAAQADAAWAVGRPGGHQSIPSPG